MLAEWEPQSAVQLTWPHKDTDWAPILPEITAVYEEMKREIESRETVIVVDDIPHNDTWARDHGFITVEENGQLILLDFKFNGWGEKFAAELDNDINRQLYEQQLVKGIYESHLDFVLEGGSIESDGKGTIFTTTCCLMAPHRNQPLTQQEIEQQLKEWLGAENTRLRIEQLRRPNAQVRFVARQAAAVAVHHDAAAHAALQRDLVIQGRAGHHRLHLVVAVAALFAHLQRKIQLGRRQFRHFHLNSSFPLFHKTEPPEKPPSGSILAQCIRKCHDYFTILRASM